LSLKLLIEMSELAADQSSVANCRRMSVQVLETEVAEWMWSFGSGLFEN
jgi:hypothetical protein